MIFILTTLEDTPNLIRLALIYIFLLYIVTYVFITIDVGDFVLLLINSAKLSNHRQKYNNYE